MSRSEPEPSMYQIKDQDTNRPGTSAKGEQMPHLEINEKPKISTLVFMDLESTGLPSDVGKRNVHITEMCLVAVDRNSFEIDEKLRVLNKVNLCIKPRFEISPGAMMITGLYNDILESQEEFDDSVPRLLEYFFRRLQKPICLLAHNGNRFDFPVLQAELNRLNYSLTSDVVCADTLVAFRSICLSRKQFLAADNERKVKEEEIHSKLVQPCKDAPISDEDIDSLLSEDLECFTNIDDALMLVNEKTLEKDLTEVLLTENNPDTLAEIETAPREFLSPSQNEKTPERINTLNFNSNKNVRKRKIADPTYLPKYQYAHNKKKIIPAKRILFPESHSPPPLEIHKITRFSLENLYSHFFHESPPNSHYAEVDCISLSKVCQKVNKDFLHWIDENSVAFSEINALW